MYVTPLQDGNITQRNAFDLPQRVIDEQPGQWRWKTGELNNGSYVLLAINICLNVKTLK